MSRRDALAAADVRDAAPLFAALGDPTRLRLLGRLSADGPTTVTRLTIRAAVTRQAVAKHLVVLEDAGLVTSARDGRARVYELAPDRLAAARAYLDRLGVLWDDALDRLAAFVEEGEPPAP